MKNLITWVFICSLIMACNSSKKDLPKSKIDELRTNFTETLRTADSTYSLDSFRFIKLDTLTMLNKRIAQLNAIISEIENINDKSRLILDKYKYNLQLASLSSGLSGTLYRNYKMEADDNKTELDGNHAKVDKLTKAHDSLNVLAQKADTTTPIAYQAVCVYQFRRKDQSVTKDTTYILLNRDKNIIKNEDFLKD